MSLLLPFLVVGSPPSSNGPIARASDTLDVNEPSDYSMLAALPPGGTFTDDNGSIFEGAIEAIAAAGITKGCNPPANNRFCPGDAVTRGEMAVFIARARGVAPAEQDYFVDDDGRFYENAANRIRRAAVTRGCNPPINNTFCGERSLTRGEMAAFLVRAFNLTDDGGGDLFDDDNSSQFERAIDRLGTAGITKGCNPPDNDLFCPGDVVTRGQMAAFISRVLGLQPIVPPPISSPPPVGQVDGTITGTACEGGCLVTGAVELKGNVNLQGDLMVDGGTLFARPGVNLNGNGFQIMFMNGGNADFQGSKTQTWSGNGSNPNVKRDLNFRDLRRIMFHKGVDRSILRYFAIHDSGTSALGDYPLHFHLNGNTTRGTLVEGVAVVDGKHHAFVPHGSHGITFRNTIAMNTRGEAFWWDPPGTNSCDLRPRFCEDDNSNDIVIDRALAYGIRDRPLSGIAANYRLNAFQLGAGSGNVLTNSVARDINGGVQCSGFHWPGSANHNVGGTVWTFEDNRSIDNNCNGIFVWQNDTTNPEHTITGFVGRVIEHGAYINRYHYVEPDVDNFVVHALGWRGVTGGRIGHLTFEKHQLASNYPIVFEGVEIGSVVIDNRDGDDSHPGKYEFNETGISCSDIEYESIVSGTEILVDGQSC